MFLRVQAYTCDSDTKYRNKRMSYVLLNVSIALLAGLLMMRVFTKMRLPDVTAYLIAGVLIGPYCLGGLGIHGLGFTSMHEVEMLSLLSEVALGMCATAM